MNLEKYRRSLSGFFIEPAINIIQKTHVSPNGLTWIGFCISLAAAVLIGCNYLIPAGLVVAFGGYFDMLDGALARRLNKVTVFGGILDSTLDRLSEAALLTGAAVLFMTVPGNANVLMFLNSTWAVALVLVTLITSQTVSYIRARAEAAGLECKVGIGTRTERVILLILGLLTGWIIIALILIAVLSTITVVQRLVVSSKADSK